ncbi:MAG: hypothetical protein KVP17_002322 [Porospora cf. gigantea B]|uniref:uncharacterized protein n=1 Tax=Porospora cf. gigantea B TaxID=2853592 RepID=UPI003571E46C|nr:MAG: hypothetical protein KVP17_002322 [Porospora cf. gigantea B]
MLVSVKSADGSPALLSSISFLVPPLTRASPAQQSREQNPLESAPPVPSATPSRSRWRKLFPQSDLGKRLHGTRDLFRVLGAFERLMTPSEKEEVRRQMLHVVDRADIAIANLFWTKKPFFQSSANMSVGYCFQIMFGILVAGMKESSQHCGETTAAVRRKIQKIRQVLQTEDASSAGQLALVYLREMASITESDIQLLSSDWAEFQRNLQSCLLTRVTRMAPKQCTTTWSPEKTEEALAYIGRLPEIVDAERDNYPPEALLPPKKELDDVLADVLRMTATVPSYFPSVPRFFKFDADFKVYPPEFQALFTALTVIHPDYSSEVLDLMETCRQDRERSGSQYPESFAILKGLYNVALLQHETFLALGHWAYVDLLHYLTSPTNAELFDKNIHLLADDVRNGKQTQEFTAALVPKTKKWLKPHVEEKCPICWDEIDEQDFNVLNTFKEQWTSDEMAPNFDPLKQLTQTFSSQVDINYCGHISHVKCLSNCIRADMPDAGRISCPVCRSLWSGATREVRHE